MICKYCKIIFVLIFLCLLTGCSQKDNDTAAVSIETQQKIVDYLNTEIPVLLKKYHVPGAAAIVVTPNQVVWKRGFGQLSKTDKTPVTPATLFAIQSTSKMFTATGVLLAAQKGRVDLNVPIQKYLSNFKIHSRFSKHPLAEITLKHLLSHTAGLPHEAPIGNNFNNTSPSFDAHIKSIQQVWLRYPVGQRYAYSNLGIDLAGYILQKQFHQPFVDYMQQYVLNPIGMTSSTFDYQRYKNIKNRAVGTIEGLDKAPLYIPIIPCGGLYTNVEDMGRFLQFQLNDGKAGDKQLLAKHYIHLMRTIPFPVKGQKYGYGLGIEFDRFNGVKIFDHNGGGFGFNSEVFWFPKHKFGVAVFENGGFGDEQMKLMLDIVSILLHGKVADDQLKIDITPTSAIGKPQTIGKQMLQKWVGNYIGRDGVVRYIGFQDNKFSLIPSSKTFDQFRPLIYMGKNEFYEPVEQQSFRFMPAKNGVSQYIVRIECGLTWDYNDGPNDKPGPNKKAWQKYVGNYQYKQNNWLTKSAHISIKNGYLYYNQYRLHEYKPGLFFSCDGQTLDIRGGKVLVWNNAVVLKKIIS